MSELVDDVEKRLRAAALALARRDERIKVLEQQLEDERQAHQIACDMRDKAEAENQRLRETLIFVRKSGEQNSRNRGRFEDATIAWSAWDMMCAALKEKIPG